MKGLPYTLQEKRIWDINKGDILVAKKTMYGDNYPFGEVQLFTELKEYEVLEVLPLHPCVVILDDEGQRNKIDGDFIINFDVLAVAACNQNRTCSQSAHFSARIKSN